MKYVTNLEMNKNEIQNAVAHLLATAPSNPVKGQEYFNTTDNAKYIYNGTEWVSETTQGKTYDGTLPITVNNTAGTIGVNNANSSAKGVIQIATEAEVTEGIDTKKAVTPALLQKKINDNAYKLPTDVVQDSAYNHTDNNYTTDEKTKLSGIASGAEVNVKSDWSETTTSSDAYIKNKPTLLSQFTNDPAFIDNTVENLVNYYKKTETYTKTEVNGLISAIPKFSVQVVESLPTTNISTTTIYLVPTETDSDINSYDEYIYVNNSWEFLGTTAVDLSNYYTKTEADARFAPIGIVTSKPDKFTATNSALSPVGGACTWSITHNLGNADVVVQVKEVSTGDMVMTDVRNLTADTTVITILSGSALTANTYKAVIIG